MKKGKKELNIRLGKGDSDGSYTQLIWLSGLHSM
jgi:hypothetical protein